MADATSGGSFDPSQHIQFTGTVDFQIAPTVRNTEVIATTGAIQTLTNKILTAPVINAPTTSTNNGAVLISPGSIFPGTVTAVEYGDGFFHQTKITFTNVPITLTLATTGAGILLYGFPQGVITILGASGNMTETTTSILADTLNASKTYNWGVGSVTQSTGALATTQQDIIPSTNGTSSATINVAGAASLAARTAAPAQFDGNASALFVYFNVGIATASDIDADATTTWSGALTISWVFNGLAA